LNYIRRSRHGSPGEHQRCPYPHIVQEQMAGSGAHSAPDSRAETEPLCRKLGQRSSD